MRLRVRRTCGVSGEGEKKNKFRNQMIVVKRGEKENPEAGIKTNE